MRVYRVFPHVEGAAAGQPGHPLFIHPDQGLGRWDNPDLYRLLYVASSASAAVGESFAGLSRWSTAMLPVPTIARSRRRLGVYQVDDQFLRLLEFDDAKNLLDRDLRPTDIVKRNRARTQEIARRGFGEARWAGLSWWSMHRPEWSLHALWDLAHVAEEGVEDLAGHPAVHEAADLLARVVDPGLA